MLNIFRETKTCQQKNMLPSVKYGGGSFMVYSCFAASGPGMFAILRMKSKGLYYILPQTCNIGSFFSLN